MTVNSNTLLRLYKSKRENIRLVPQGFRLNNFREYKGLKICKADNNDKVVIGYIGGLNYRLNFELLMKIIKQNYNWEFHFIGPLQKNPEDKFYDSAKSIVKLLSLSNVKHDVIEDKKRIPHIIDGFTIGIIPYNDKDDHNRYCYPMKLFEYFYMGKPVVSTPIEEMKRFPKFVKIGKNAGEWEGIIKKLLSKPWPEKYKQEQRKLAIENSWENKIEAISKILEKK